MRIFTVAFAAIGIAACHDQQTASGPIAGPLFEEVAPVPAGCVPLVAGGQGTVFEGTQTDADPQFGVRVEAKDGDCSAHSGHLNYEDRNTEPSRIYRGEFATVTSSGPSLECVDGRIQATGTVRRERDGTEWEFTLSLCDNGEPEDDALGTDRFEISVTDGYSFSGLVAGNIDIHAAN